MGKFSFNHRTLPQGYQLGDYVIQDLLGQGGFGIAYLAQDIHLQNQVVIKEYFPSDLASRDGQTVSALGTNGQIDYERGMARFLEEGRALARFNHPAVVRILKYFQQNNTAYLVMEFIDGEPLDSYLKRKHTLTPEVVEHLAKELLDGLEVVHQHGLIHRDIKPANIMLRPGGKPVLIDFGAAKEELAEKSHSVVVTPGYGALEQYSSKAKLAPATDLYAVGATLYKCLTAQTPEEATARVIDDTHIPVNQLPIAQQCPPGLVALIDQCMQLKEKERPQSAQEAKSMLVEIPEHPLRQPPEPKLESNEKALKSNKTSKAPIIGIVVIALILGGGYVYQQHHAEKQSLLTQPKAPEDIIEPQNQAQPDTLLGGRYLDNQDGTITDTITNLTWMRCSLGQTWTGETCLGDALELNWSQASSLGEQTTLAGYDDWRLPNLDELYTLVYCSSNSRRENQLDLLGRAVREGNYQNWLDGRCDGVFQSPTIYLQAFLEALPSEYWTGSAYPDSADSLWIVDFSDGSTSTDYWRNNLRVRLVRSL
ncbi:MULTISPECIES: protein kinase domain-containing protein [Nitrincola]|uniref:Serine/threonine-protein kinase C n=1 Tax=Nitrincola nitratireducens TaxID=1229521 RepID=W9UPI9_9GAMM|nr:MULTISPECIES: protein kinase [Nitrincola]EXJ09123.1 Serine/threonine-protein kinase C [Nitrincola nitratireducens]